MPSGTVVYHYDLAGNLISETTETGAPIRDYVWQDVTPLAQIDVQAGTETLVFLHTDHLQTPRLATNTSGTAVWRWEGEAFGNTPPNEDVDGDGQATIINGRFPGQYADAETGFYYNWNRYYGPTTGRYVTSDAIGLAGGLNTYLYVSARPTHFTDRFGFAEAPIDCKKLGFPFEPDKCWTNEQCWDHVRQMLGRGGKPGKCQTIANAVVKFACIRCAETVEAACAAQHERDPSCDTSACLTQDSRGS